MTGEDEYRLEIEFENMVSQPVDFKPSRLVPETVMHRQMKQIFGGGVPPGIKRLMIERVQGDDRKE